MVASGAKDFPHGKQCTTIFSGSGKLEKIHDMLVKEVRKMVGKNETPSVGIIDS
nr:hypothetical protein [Wolbachia endosymbiont (group B) of Ischnura elegans]